MKVLRIGDKEKIKVKFNEGILEELCQLRSSITRENRREYDIRNKEKEKYSKLQIYDENKFSCSITNEDYNNS